VRPDRIAPWLARRAAFAAGQHLAELAMVAQPDLRRLGIR
jgi:hypothetical protein